MARLLPLDDESGSVDPVSRILAKFSIRRSNSPATAYAVAFFTLSGTREGSSLRSEGRLKAIESVIDTNQEWNNIPFRRGKANERSIVREVNTI